MASAENVRLSITPLPDGRVTVTVAYQIQGTDLDVAAQQSYLEICELVGRDTPVPSDVNDQVLHELHRDTVLFENSDAMTRTRVASLPVSTLDEDPGGAQADEICARVRLVRAPSTNAYSNLVRVRFTPPVAPPSPSADVGRGGNG